MGVITDSWLEAKVKEGKLTTTMLYEEFGAIWSFGISFYARKAIAGPICVCTCTLPPNHGIPLDSKKKFTLTECYELHKEIRKKAPWVELGWIPAHNIIRFQDLDKLYLAAIARSSNCINAYHPCDIVIFDGYQMPVPTNGMLAARAKTFTIKNNGPEICDLLKAARIVCRVAHHTIMLYLDRSMPEYNFKSNMGFYTKEHIEAIQKFGWTPQHREVKHLLGMEDFKLFMNPRWT